IGHDYARPDIVLERHEAEAGRLVTAGAERLAWIDLHNEPLWIVRIGLPARLNDEPCADLHGGEVLLPLIGPIGVFDVLERYLRRRGKPEFGQMRKAILDILDIFREAIRYRKKPGDRSGRSADLSHPVATGIYKNRAYRLRRFRRNLDDDLGPTHVLTDDARCVLREGIGSFSTSQRPRTICHVHGSLITHHFPNILPNSPLSSG